MFPSQYWCFQPNNISNLCFKVNYYQTFRIDFDQSWPHMTWLIKVESILESAEKDFPDNENVQNRAKNLDSKYQKIIEMAEVSLNLAPDYDWSIYQIMF